MNFGDVLESYRLLQQRLVVHLGGEYPADVSVLPPSSATDELSFIRLVAWSYVLLQETCRVHIGFLKELPPLDSFGKALPHVAVLRTWTSHQLRFDKDRDVRVLADAQQWFRLACGASVPGNTEQWMRCFERLCDDMNRLLRGAIAACEHLDDATDGSRLVADLRGRIDRNWAAFKFDEVVRNCAIRFGYEGLDVVAFRQRQLDKWRTVVATAREDSMHRLLEQRVEADLLNLLESALPLTGQELLKKLGNATGEQLVACMLMLRGADRRTMSVSDLITVVESGFLTHSG